MQMCKFTKSTYIVELRQTSTKYKYKSLDITMRMRKFSPQKCLLLDEQQEMNTQGWSNDSGRGQGWQNSIKIRFLIYFPCLMISIFTVRVRVGARSKHMFRAHIKLKLFFKNFTSSLEMNLKFYIFSRIRISTLCVDIRVP